MNIYLVTTDRQFLIASNLCKDQSLIFRSASQIPPNYYDCDLVIFNDVRPDISFLKSRFSSITLYQEGLIPYFNLSYNFRSTTRNFLRYPPFSFFTNGFKPYFFNGCHKIITSFDKRVFDSVGINAEITVTDDVLRHSPVHKPNTPNMFFGGAFISNGMKRDHIAQLNNYFSLKSSIPDLIFKPHPRDVSFFSKNFISNLNICTESKYGSNAYGNVSTALLESALSGIPTHWILDGHSNIVCKAYKNNIQPFLKRLV